MFTLDALPYATNALEPYISANTMSYHYGKHHQTYLDNLNKLAAGTKFESMSIEGVMIESWKDKNMPIFNNSAQVWNHTFYWKSMKPNGGSLPKGKFLDAINSSFGSFDTFVEQFKNAALTQFGSGWAWLVKNKDGKLEIVKTGNAENPMTSGFKPLLTIDVWEHAYYLDYQNKRAAYVDAFFAHLANWDFASQNLDK